MQLLAGGRWLGSAFYADWTETPQQELSRLLDDASACLEPGKIVALLGCNGAGKTTRLRMLAGLSEPDSGLILFDGEIFHPSQLESRRRAM